MTQLTRRSLTATLIASLASTAFGQEQRPPRPGEGTARLEIFDNPPPSHRLSRQVVDLPDGSRYQIFRAVPVALPPADGFPTIYMLDGNAAFDRLRADDLLAHPGLVFLGIGYDTDRMFETERRAMDYTPALAADRLMPDPTSPHRLAGGAETFRNRLTGPIRAAAEKDILVDPARRTLWGHSYGGLFTVFTLFTAPEAFANYAAASPSLWWADGVLMNLEPAARPIPPGTHVFIGAGSAERRTGSTAPLPTAPAERTVDFVQRLRDRGADVRFEVFEGLGHGATFAASYPFALTLAERG